MSDYVDNFDWGMQFEEELDETDWTRAYEELMAGPYRVIWEEEGGMVEGQEQGVMHEADGTQPVERIRSTEVDLSGSQSSRHILPPLSIPMLLEDSGIHEASGSEQLNTTATATASAVAVGNGSKLTCDFDGCSSRPFKRRGDLARHKKKHAYGRRSCPAEECVRVGSRGFTRIDKLRDHMLAGHDDETTFECIQCPLRLPRDLMGVHVHGWYGFDGYRTCPLPRCSFKVNVRWDTETQLDKLAFHLQEKHEPKQRNDFANLLRQRGYDAQTCDVVCPLCPGIDFSLKHEDFQRHFMRMHFHCQVCGSPKWVKNHSATCTHNFYGRESDRRLSECTDVPDEVKQHRRTILRVWPGFARYPVWDDIKDCNERSAASQG
ncbi:hypothetical protein BKA63DRAFT_492364 [Paraphoma chrysanthemicola]|nr:hypothetical protein BKA63DRAFT_492364 [Paraphoma chrysanthemicola]